MEEENNKSFFPKFKKKVNAFLVGEDGKISKETLLKTGLALGTVAMATSSISAVDVLSLGAYNPDGSITATHTSHASHGSHGSHGSHASHGQW